MNNQLTQKILFATSLIIFVVTIAALVVANTARYGTEICLGFQSVMTNLNLQCKYDYQWIIYIQTNK